ncbi:MAG: hypothetical protein ACHBN1_19335 [Heteroscytonema crispum UTEX LB 1556]
MGTLNSKLASVAFVTALIVQQPAQAVTLFWDLNFFDNTGTLVGNGDFTSEPDKTIIGTTRRPGPNSTVIEENFEVKNYLTNFSANLLGREWLDSSTQPQIA